MFGVQFYPTPELIAEKVWNKIDWQRVKSLLEPSAGKGDLLVGINRSENKEHELFSGKKIMIDTVPRKVKFIDCIEIDSNLASILREKGYNVIVGDFLNHHTYTRYDCILMNPPFKEGDKHLMKALDMCKFGGQVCCILNAETIKNPCSTIRQELVSRLANYNADIEFIEHGFRDSERKTDVEIAIVYVDIPKIQYNEGILSSMKIADIFNGLMAVPNLVALFALGGVVAAETKVFFEKVKKGEEIMAIARQERKKIVLLAGRPYHADPEINHGIHKLIAGLGFAVISEDSIACKQAKFDTNIVAQWTFHQRLFSAAKYAADSDDIFMVQLVSFGCGLDALTTDEEREILEATGKLYTQIKIDEVTNLGAVKIRLRSLMAAIESGKGDAANE